MTTPSAAETILLNSIDHRSDLHLSIYQPELAMLAQITGSYSHETQSVNFILISGSSLNVTDGYFQMALIGTTPMSEDKDRTWVRYVSGSSIRFVESDHIDWQDGLYITVYKFTEIIPVFPRIIQNPADETDVIFYKNWDVPYTNQNEIMGSFICMGSNFAGYLENGLGQVFYTASGTYNLNGDALTFSWSFEGGTPSGSTSHTPGYISYNAPGFYRTILTVTSSEGAIDTSIRYIAWHTQPQFPQWELNEPPSGARDGTGYSCRIKVRNENSQILDGSLVVIFTDDWYGNVKQHISNNDLGRESIYFWGYIKNGTIQHNYQDKWVEFEVVSPAGIMEISECFSCSVEAVNNPSTWFELKEMNIAKAIYHYLRWQSSVLLCCDVQYNANDRFIQYFDADRISLYDAVNTLMSGARKGRIVSDILGKLWIEQEFNAMVSGSSQFPTSWHITSDDWIGEPIIDEIQEDEVAFLEIGGIKYVPSGTGSFSAYLCDAPGVGPKYRGKVERIQGLALDSQEELNDLAGALLAHWNSRYPNSEFTLRTNFANFDIAPQQQVLVTMFPNENTRGIYWNAKPFVIRGVSWRWDAKTGTKLPTLKLAEIVDGFAGETIIIPDVPPGGGQNGGTTRTPPVSVPPLPPAATPSLISLYDEHIYKGKINALDIIGADVQAFVSGTVGYIVHSGSGGGSTGTAVGGAVNAVNHVSATLGADNSGYTTSSEVTHDEPESTAWDIEFNNGNIISSSNVSIEIPTAGMYDVFVNVNFTASIWTTTNLATYLVIAQLGRLDYSGGSQVATGSRTFTNHASNLITISNQPITVNYNYAKQYTAGQTIRFDVSVVLEGSNGGKIKGGSQQNFTWSTNISISKIG